ncbi:DMSO/selenate family reductase complex B subunit [Ferrimonas senticii]|uniref:DMSO/selenate family reductase complex B subunit n=1 Tax=Ferrimonas senticii TaxID=394566 RepID=UPI000480C8C5|nr:DMSO/selenate family reductase complex B subunit [Ferrimonas senticii]
MTQLTQYGFHVDTRKCSGCKTCQVACKDKNELNPKVLWRRVYEYGGGRFSILDSNKGTYTNNVFAYNVSISCNHCGDPVCLAACPTGAIHKRQANGLVVLDSSICIGCESCSKACPYDAPQLDATQGVMTKCDGCYELVEQGKKPLCVTSCPLRALDFGLMEELRERYPGATTGDIYPLPSSHITKPNLLVTHNVSSSRNDGSIMNPREV